MARFSVSQRRPVRTFPFGSATAYIAYFLILTMAIVVSRSNIGFDLRSRATGTPADIVVIPSSTQGQLRTDVYHAFAQGGEERDDMLKPVLPYVSALHPKLIRLDHVFDNYHIVSGSHGSLAFDFSALDAAVTTIRATGAIPLFALSYMPAAIAQGGDITGPPADWNDWSLIVQRFIEHYSGRQGMNIPDVRYEVWNEPDLFGRWTLGGSRDYMTLYRYASRGARQAAGVNRFYLGGPATTSYREDWIRQLVTSGLRVDFLSFHTYDMNPSALSEAMSNLERLGTAVPEVRDLPVLITEYGFTGNRDARYGTSFAAAYTAAAIRQILDTKAEYLFTFQLKDGPGQGNDGWGLLTHETAGIHRKPRYTVFPFLDAMAGTRVRVSGEGTYVRGFASERDGVTRLLLVNYDPERSHTEAVPVTFAPVAQGVYTLTKSFLGGQTSVFNYTASRSAVTTKIYMPVNSVVRLELRKETDGFGPLLGN